LSAKKLPRKEMEKLAKKNTEVDKMWREKD